MVMEDSKKLDTLDKKLKKLEKDFKIREVDITFKEEKLHFKQIRSSRDAYAFIRDVMFKDMEIQEHMIVLFMDHSNTITGYHRHSKGTINSTSVDIEVILADIKSGKVTEAFGCGTAAVISPVGQLCFKGEDYFINDNKAGEVSRNLYDELTGIQYGRREDKFGWIVKVDCAE